MSKFKLRFSYFLLLGIVGFVLQLISFFCFNDATITSSNLQATDSKKFVEFITNSIVLLISCIFIAAMFVGYIIGKKKEESKHFQIASWSGAITQGLIFLVTLIYLIFAASVRKELFKVDENKNLLAILINIRYALVILSFASTTLFALNLSQVRNNSKLSNVTNKILLGVNAIAFVLFVVVAFTSFVNEAHTMLTHLYEIRQTPPYGKIYPSYNGFTLAQFMRLTYIPGECMALESRGNFASSAYLAMAALVTYVTTIVVNLFWSVIHLIESFDIERDSNPMEI